MLIGRHDVENLMRLDPASSCFQNSLDQGIPETNASDEETTEVEMELSDILLNLRPIKQVPTLLKAIVHSYVLGTLIALGEGH